jgi:uncharacterized protein (TIGR00251 family)
LRRTCCDGPTARTADGVRVAVRLTPRASADRCGGVVRSTDGSPAVHAYVTAPPVDDRANEALLRLLARAWRLPRRDLTIVAGATSRHKTVHIVGDTDSLLSRLAAPLTEPGTAAAPTAR